MDRLEAMAIFVAVVEGGSLAFAARTLGRSPASVTRAVAQLEAAAGERLLERTTRRFSVTEAGTRHVASYRSILEQVTQLVGAEQDQAVQGTVVITAPELFGRLHVMPVVESFLKLYPDVQVRVLLLNRVVDLVGEGVDVAFRLAELPDSTLKVIKIGEVRPLICAANAYLDRHGSPEHPSDLQHHSCIGLNDAGAQELWRYSEPKAPHRTRSVRVTCRLSVNSAAAAIAAAERGLGIVRPLSYQVEHQIADGCLVALLSQYELRPVPINMVLQPGCRRQGALRAFIEYAAPLLRKSAAP
ncbi:LysR family transcriptional regulator [Devosia sp. Naph2]|uniref:LysR family transcriptional regulator n=1 Tax=Devosia polycyclovorans TaxID=3345148 RepID=UPI0035D04A6E